MGRRTIHSGVHFWGPFLHLTSLATQKVSTNSARRGQFSTFRVNGVQLFCFGLCFQRKVRALEPRAATVSGENNLKDASLSVLGGAVRGRKQCWQMVLLVRVLFLPKMPFQVKNFVFAKRLPNGTFEHVLPSLLLGNALSAWAWTRPERTKNPCCKFLKTRVAKPS